jgi:hypothetical protein
MRTPALAFLLLILPACSWVDAGDEPASPVVMITTGAVAYDYGPDLSITVTLDNRSHAPVYFDPCGAVFLDEVEDGAVVGSWQLLFLRCSARAELGPGQRGARTFDFALLESYVQGAALDQTVRYRLRFASCYHDAAFTRPLGEASRVSNRFRLIR